MAAELTVVRTSRGFPIARGFDRYGQPWSIQDSSLAEEACIWLGSEGEEGGRAHLTQADAVALIPLLQAFVEGGSIANETAGANPPASSGAMRAVFQPWVADLTLMQQTVLLTAVRGPDGVPKYGPTKMLLRWYRRCILLSAMDQAVLSTPHEAGGGSFTGPSFDALYGSPWCMEMDEIVGAYLRELDGIPHHFQLHFLHAAEIVGYKHPDDLICEWWRGTYERLVHDMHLWPETEEQLDRRLGDNRDQWLERNDVATID